MTTHNESECAGAPCCNKTTALPPDYGIPADPVPKPMTDVTITDHSKARRLHVEGVQGMTNGQIANAIRIQDKGGTVDLTLPLEALARLLEADAKNHDMLAAGAMKWRGLCERALDVIEVISDPLILEAAAPDAFKRLREVMRELREALGVTAPAAGKEGV